MQIKQYHIDKSYAVLSRIDNMGSQSKFHKNGYWYKYDTLGAEGTAEQLVSDFLSCTNITDYVTYEQCEINGRSGCRSKSFLREGENLITFDMLYRNVFHTEILSDKIASLQDAQPRLDFLLDFIKNTTGLDAETYLYHNICLDMIIRNPDRHFNNLAVILDKDGKFRFAPIFDNGQGLTANFQITPPYLTDEEKEEQLCAATISGSFELQYLAIQKRYKKEPLTIDYSRLETLLKEKYKKDNIMKKYLCNSVQRYRTVFPDFNKEEEYER